MNTATPPITPSAEQERIIAAAHRGSSILITGGAGVGKSFVLRTMIERLNGRLPVTASTGIAAINVGGVTLHSFAGLGLADMPADKLCKLVRDKPSAVQRLRKFNRLAIDEISMVSAELMDKLNAVLKYIRENDLPFGGMQIIAIGDFLQLPPVTRGTATGPRFAFESAAWKEAGFRVGELTKIFRQEDTEFATALNTVRKGIMDESSALIFRSRYKADDPTPEKPIVEVFCMNRDVDAENERRLERIDGEPREFLASDTGEPQFQAAISKNCLAPTVLRLKVGAQVMLLANLDVEAGLANGSTGIVGSFSEDTGEPVVHFTNGLIKRIERTTWEIKIDSEIVATRTQVPLRLAWAITAHKSQGMSIDRIRVHLAGVFEAGQAYVALSRARTLPGLFIASTSKGCVKANPAALKFYEEAERI